MERLYREEGAESAVDKGLWHEILRIINEGTVEGLSQAAAPPAHDELFCRELRHSNEVFAAFKAHTMADEMAAKLYDAGGHLKPFRIWERDVSSIKSHQVGSWLRTEYDTAVIRAHNAADWREFERNKDVMPNLRWMPTTSPEPDSIHSRYWKARLTLPVGHPFWDMHRPGDRWNCKCSLEATDEPANPEALDSMEDVKPQRGLENNPGKDGHTFSDSHPYFPKDCRHCFAYRNSGFKNRLKGWFKNQQKDCYNCPYINECMPKTEEYKTLPKTEKERKKANKAEYNRLKRDANYTDVHFDKETGGLKATHVGHQVHSAEKEDIFFGKYTSTQLENRCVDQLYRMGHKIILCDESKRSPEGNLYTALDIRLNGIIMDIRSITTENKHYGGALIAKNIQLKKYNARPDVPEPADSVCLYFEEPSLFEERKATEP